MRGENHQLPDLIGIHSVHSNQGIFIEGFQPQTPLEQLLINRELQLVCQMLAGDETFDHPSDSSLLLNIDKRFELHRGREGSESSENLWVCWGLEGASNRVDANGFVWCGWVDQIRQVAVAVQL